MSSVMSEIDSGRMKMLEETIEEVQTNQKQFHVFVLVNSRSGSCHGRQLIKKFGKATFFKHGDNQITYFYVHDLDILNQINYCFTQVKKFCEERKKVRIIVGGGDGTVQWIIEESIKQKIDFRNVIFGVLPIGTGNDFAHSIGWETFNFQASENKMKQLAIRLSQCQVGSYDAWDCRIECFSLGTITEIKNGKQRHLEQKILSKTFTNYFGVGCDAQVSYVSQKINAKSVFFKKLAYGIAGLYSFFTFTKKLSKKLIRFVQRGQKIHNEQIEMSNQLFEDSNIQHEIEQGLQIDQADSCVTFLNSTTSMQLDYIWETPYSIQKNKKYVAQRVDDGMMEIVSYRNQFSLGFERSFHTAKKVGQGKGPFMMNIKQGEAGKDEITYIHINGEPYKINNLKSIQISKSKQVPDSRIRVFTCKKK